MLFRSVLFWSPLEITCNKVVEYEKSYYGPLRYLPGFPAVLALFICGTVIFLDDLRKRQLLRGTADADVHSREMSALILAFILVYFVSFLPFFVNGRARVPVIPFFLLVGAYGVYRYIGFIRERNLARAGTWAGVFVALYLLASIQYIPFQPDEARWHYQRAESYLRTGKAQEAVEEGRKVIDIDS